MNATSKKQFKAMVNNMVNIKNDETISTATLVKFEEETMKLFNENNIALYSREYNEFIEERLDSLMSEWEYEFFGSEDEINESSVMKRQMELLDEIKYAEDNEDEETSNMDFYILLPIYNAYMRYGK